MWYFSPAYCSMVICAHSVAIILGMHVQGVLQDILDMCTRRHRYVQSNLQAAQHEKKTRALAHPCGHWLERTPHSHRPLEAKAPIKVRNATESPLVATNEMLSASHMVVGSRNSVAFMSRSGTITGLPASLIHTQRKRWEHVPWIGNVYYLVVVNFDLQVGPSVHDYRCVYGWEGGGRSL
jgi:hypothetical protein